MSRQAAWTPKEDVALICHVYTRGTRWAHISAQLGRTTRACSTRWRHLNESFVAASRAIAVVRAEYERSAEGSAAAASTSIELPCFEQEHAPPRGAAPVAAVEEQQVVASLTSPAEPSRGATVHPGGASCEQGAMDAPASACPSLGEVTAENEIYDAPTRTEKDAAAAESLRSMMRGRRDIGYEFRGRRDFSRGIPPHGESLLGSPEFEGRCDIAISHTFGNLFHGKRRRGK